MKLGIFLRGATVTAALAGLCCGRPSSTLVLQLASTGTPPSGIGRVPLRIESLKAWVTTPQGAEWALLVSDEEGARSVDLAHLTGELFAERDIPRGAVSRLRLSFDMDEAGPLSTFELVDGGTVPVVVPFAPVESDALALALTFDLSRSFVPAPDGGMLCSPQASVTVLR